MKFLLTIQICSALMQQCTPPLEVGMYNSHYDCATAGFIKGLGVIREFGEEYTNENRMLMNFACTPQEST
jgi:hypothetical protein